ncbi:uncharacterized protein LOC144601032 isoform X2 [Rhinoraja longicauda]
MSFGIWPSSMRWTWPSHRSLSRVYILGRPALDRISALDTLSCQDIPRIRRMLLRWKGLGAVAVDGAPWRSTDSGRCRQRNCDLQLTGGAAIGGPEGAQASFPHSTPRPRTSATKHDIRRLQRIVRTAEKVVGCNLPPIDELHCKGQEASRQDHL